MEPVLQCILVGLLVAVALVEAEKLLIQADTPSRYCSHGNRSKTALLCMFVLWAGEGIKSTSCVPVVVRRPLAMGPENGKLGTTSEGFSTTQQIRIGETCA